VVHALPSSQPAVLLALTQPVGGLQLSSVQGLLSLQSGAGPPTHVPPAHASDVVHALPSSQPAVLSALTQPVDGLHESSVHGLLSLQSGAGPPTQAPFAHTSPVVHALPSSQVAVLFALTQPVDGLQESSVHGLLSLQSVAALPRQTPPLQTSTVVQALPSSQLAVLFTCTHPETGLQLSSVHGLSSSQLGSEPPTQAPPAHTSGVVHTLPSLQAYPSGRSWSAGQLVLVPSHTSTTSH